MFQGKIVRIARPTDQLDKVVRFYTEGLGFKILYQFENHEEFDGVMIGIPGEPYHLSSRITKDTLWVAHRHKII